MNQSRPVRGAQHSWACQFALLYMHMQAGAAEELRPAYCPATKRHLVRISISIESLYEFVICIQCVGLPTSAIP